MNKSELNNYAVNLVQEEFKKYGFKIAESSLAKSQVSFNTISPDGKVLKIKVRAISQIGSYVFSRKANLNIEDPNWFVVIVYIPYDSSIKDIYIVPATEWGKDIYPFKGKDYNKPGQVSEPEWGISFSQKAKDVMESHEFSIMIDKLT